MQRILVVEPVHGARSQMAEAILRHSAAHRYDIGSAGIEPAGSVTDVADVLREVGIGGFVPAQRPLAMDRQPAPDLLVIVCEEGCGSCPYVPGARRVVRWPQPDPKDLTPRKRIRALRQIRDDLQARAASLPELLPA
jgi:protein-tyrosine-phosphatase